MIFKGSSNEYLQIEYITQQSGNLLGEYVKNGLTLLWFLEDDNHLKVDNKHAHYNKNQVICLTEFHKVEVLDLKKTRMIRFNRDFYCVIDHDSEVSCKGILFFGASQLPFFTIQKSDLKVFETVFDMFILELETQDNLQLSMLQMMLKRFLILSTRLFKNQTEYQKMDSQQTNLIREYNFLVEQFFKTKHTVSEYAELLNKSPKTLSNIFSRFSNKTPLQYIQERKMLEARRLLRYTDISIKEIAFELGFEDIHAFSRFFKNIEKKSPTDYRDHP